MPKASWNGETIAESDETIVVDGNHYFPPQSLREAYFQESTTTSNCPWKGIANYYHVQVDGKTNTDAAWYYAEPKPEASNIKDHIAFWKGVEVS
ncbi:MAG: DUF427 domain-containing protein [Planctomycetaceae bacterium]|nr:DUF427 domain-containing protein [Planctomycetaceae bacterium]